MAPTMVERKAAAMINGDSVSELLDHGRSELQAGRGADHQRSRRPAPGNEPHRRSGERQRHGGEERAEQPRQRQMQVTRGETAGDPAASVAAIASTAARPFGICRRDAVHVASVGNSPARRNSIVGCARHTCVARHVVVVQRWSTVATMVRDRRIAAATLVLAAGMGDRSMQNLGGRHAIAAAKSADCARPRALGRGRRGPGLPEPADQSGDSLPARRKHRPDGARVAARAGEGAGAAGGGGEQGRRRRHHRQDRGRQCTARRLHHRAHAQQSAHRAAARAGAALRHGKLSVRLPDLLRALCA